MGPNYFLYIDYMVAGSVPQRFNELGHTTFLQETLPYFETYVLKTFSFAVSSTFFSVWTKIES